MGQVQNERVGVQIGGRTVNVIGKTGEGPTGKVERKSYTRGGGRGGDAGEGGRMFPGHSSRWCLKCSGGFFPFIVSLNEVFMLRCILNTT